MVYYSYGLGVTMADAPDEIRELYVELERLLVQLPQPHTGSHPHQIEIKDFVADFRAATDVARVHPEVLSTLESIIATDAEVPFECIDSEDLAAAWERLEHFPNPNDAEHPYLNYIMSAVDGLRLLLIAISRVAQARVSFGQLGAPRAGGH